jgi:signal transduction histidine kinase
MSPSARMKLSRERVDLGDLVANVAAQSDELIRRSKSNLALHVSSVVGNWDRLRLETVIGNLLENAVKFGDAKPIDITVSTDDAVARLTVIDHGIGISTEAQARIFEKFERAVPEQHYGGFGLGLWIVRQIVDAHGGTVRVRSEAGHGSTFVVCRWR